MRNPLSVFSEAPGPTSSRVFVPSWPHPQWALGSLHTSKAAKARQVPKVVKVQAGPEVALLSAAWRRLICVEREE